MRNTNENEEAYINTITDMLVDAVTLRADFRKEDLDELYELFIYHIRESYLIGRVAKAMELMQDNSEAMERVDSAIAEAESLDRRISRALEEAPQ